MRLSEVLAVTLQCMQMSIQSTFLASEQSAYLDIFNEIKHLLSISYSLFIFNYFIHSTLYVFLPFEIEKLLKGLAMTSLKTTALD